MAEYPDAIARFVDRLHESNLGILRAQIEAAQGRLAGIIIWGDVAYKKGMLFSPDFWRRHFKPGVKAMIDECHSRGLPVIYHGCGNVNRIFEDFIEIGLDAYNPLEYKAGLGRRVYLSVGPFRAVERFRRELRLRVRLVRERGVYPLQLGESDLPDLG